MITMMALGALTPSWSLTVQLGVLGKEQNSWSPPSEAAAHFCSKCLSIYSEAGNKPGLRSESWHKIILRHTSPLTRRH